MQYFKKGYLVAAKKVKCLLNKMNVVTFQHMIKMPMAIPTMAVAMELTSPIYSGAKKRASAPNDFMRLPPTTLNKTTQKMSNTWYFLKWRKSNCKGRE
jgi:hypothetical protein